MPSHGRGAYRAARAATKVLNEETSRMDRDIAAWQDRIAALEAELADMSDVARDWMVQSQTRQARLAAVIALCDRITTEAQGFEPINYGGEVAMSVRIHMMSLVRAAATSDP